jgi:DNA-binding transcriptional MerR regulator
MPYKEPKIEKLYYTIGEVAKMFDVNTSLIRFWEKEFDIIKPHKNKKGNRLFTPQDVDNFYLIYHLVKEKGLTLKGAEKKLKENRTDTVENFEIVKRLKEIRETLVEIKESL